MENPKESLTVTSNTNIKTSEKEPFHIEIPSNGQVQNVPYQPPVKPNNLIRRVYSHLRYKSFFNLRKMIIDTALFRSEKGYYCYCPWAYPPRVIFVLRQPRVYNKEFFADNTIKDVYKQWYRKS